MTELTSQQKLLLDSARGIETALRLAEGRVEALRRERTISMGELHDAGVPWTEIGRMYGVSSQAAMYATGHATRKPRPKGT